MKKFVISILAVSVLSACATMERHADTIDVNSKAAAMAREQMSEMRTSGAVTKVMRPKISGDEVALVKATEIPSVFAEKFEFSSAYATEKTVLSHISKRTGFPVIYQPDPDNSMQRRDTVADEDRANLRAIDWRGSLSGLLDQVTSQIGRYWVYRDGAIHIIRTDTRTFHVYLPSGKKTLAASVSLGETGSSGGGESGGGGDVSVSSSNNVDPYGALLKSISAIVANGAAAAPVDSVVLNEALQLLTVTAAPPQLDKIANIINSVNERFAQNVMIGVQVLNLTLSNEVSAGASLNIAYQNISKNLQGALQGATLPATQSGGLPGQIILERPNGNFGGSSALIEALEDVGKVSFVTSGQVITANGQPAPIQLANKLVYLASSSTTSAVNSGTTTTLVPGTEKIGFTANFLPIILGDNRILLQYQINLSSLLALNSISSGDSTIQTPSIATQSLQQQAFLRDGQSIVLFGFEQERAAKNERASMFSFGKSSGSERTVMVIILEVSAGK